MFSRSLTTGRLCGENESVMRARMDRHGYFIAPPPDPVAGAATLVTLEALADAVVRLKKVCLCMSVRVRLCVTDVNMWWSHCGAVCGRGCGCGCVCKCSCMFMCSCMLACSWFLQNRKQAIALSVCSMTCISVW